MADKDFVHEFLATWVGGMMAEDTQALPDGSGFAVMSMPLTKDHWLTAELAPDDPYEEPPMPLRTGTAVVRDETGRSREDWAEMVRAAARWAVRASTMRGTETDFDPDAMVQNMVVGMLGYWTPDGLSHLDEIR